MADNYELLSGEHTVELLGATDVQDVYQVTARSVPSGVVYHVRFPPVIQDATSVRDILAAWAGWYNDAAALPGVVGISTLQDVDLSGQLQDVNEVTVRSTSGKLTQTIAVSGEAMGTPKVAELVNAAVAQLNAIEGV